MGGSALLIVQYGHHKAGGAGILRTPTFALVTCKPSGSCTFELRGHVGGLVLLIVQPAHYNFALAAKATLRSDPGVLHICSHLNAILACARLDHHRVLAINLHLAARIVLAASLRNGTLTELFAQMCVALRLCPVVTVGRLMQVLFKRLHKGVLAKMPVCILQKPICGLQVFDIFEGCLNACISQREVTIPDTTNCIRS